jgi:glycosyltransferase involved in cell wall biosynthesis
MLGKIVLATRGHGFDQLIQDGKTGLLCEPGDVDSLTSGLRRAATLSHDDKERIGKVAQDRIDRLAPEKIVIELLSFYQEVINRKRRRYRPNLFRRFNADDSGRADRHRATSSVIIDDR